MSENIKKKSLILGANTFNFIANMVSKNCQTIAEPGTVQNDLKLEVEEEIKITKIETNSNESGQFNQSTFSSHFSAELHLGQSDDNEASDAELLVLKKQIIHV